MIRRSWACSARRNLTSARHAASDGLLDGFGQLLPARPKGVVPASLLITTCFQYAA
jgi:hypothetical protein